MKRVCFWCWGLICWEPPFDEMGVLVSACERCLRWNRKEKAHNADRENLNHLWQDENGGEG